MAEAFNLAVMVTVSVIGAIRYSISETLELYRDHCGSIARLGPASNTAMSQRLQTESYKFMEQEKHLRSQQNTTDTCIHGHRDLFFKNIEY